MGAAYSWRRAVPAELARSEGFLFRKQCRNFQFKGGYVWGVVLFKFYRTVSNKDKCRRGKCMASVNRQSFMSKLYVLHDRCLRISWRTLFLVGKTASRSNINLTLLKLEMIGNQLFMMFVNLLFAFLLILYTASVLFSVYLCTVYYYSDSLIPSSG